MIQNLNESYYVSILDEIELSTLENHYTTGKNVKKRSLNQMVIEKSISIFIYSA